MIDPKRPEESLCFVEKQQSEGKMANTLIHIEQMDGICELEFWLDRKKEESINHDAWKSI